MLDDAQAALAEQALQSAVAHAPGALAGQVVGGRQLVRAGTVIHGPCPSGDLPRRQGGLERATAGFAIGGTPGHGQLCLHSFRGSAVQAAFAAARVST